MDGGSLSFGDGVKCGLEACVLLCQEVLHWKSISLMKPRHKNLRSMMEWWFQRYNGRLR